MTSAQAQTPLRTPGVLRRLACFVYEGVVLFGIVMVAGYLYSSLTQQRHALHGQWGLRGFLLIVLAIYFVWFWSRGGQTVAMKTWHIRLIGPGGGPVSQARAFGRYLLSWVWFMPALASVWLLDLHGGWATAAVVSAGVVGYAMSSLIAPQRQYWHDVVCGTRLIDCRQTASKTKP